MSRQGKRKTTATQTREKRKGTSRRRKLLVATLGLIVVLVAAIIAAPTVAATNWCRDAILNAALGDSTLELESDAATFDSMGPTTIEGLTVTSPDDRVVIVSELVTFDRSWWQLWWTPDELGHIDVASLDAKLRLDWQDFEGYSAGELPQFSARVKDANLLVRIDTAEQPVVDVHQVDASFRVQADEYARRLIVDDSILINDRQLTSERCSELLQLMDPLLADVVDVEGKFSLELDRLQVPLNVNPDERYGQMELVGRLRLHDVSTSAKTPLIQGIVRVASEMHNQPANDIVRVVNQSTVEFDVEDGRLHHHGLEFGLPDISSDLVIRSEGFVGLDESLDMWVLIPKLFLAENDENSKTPVAKQLAKLHITGTISRPEINRLETIDAEEGVANELPND